MALAGAAAQHHAPAIVIGAAGVLGVVAALGLNPAAAILGNGPAAGLARVSGD